MQPPLPRNIKQNRTHLNQLKDVERNRRDGKRRTYNSEKSSVIESNIEKSLLSGQVEPSVFSHLPPLPVERATRFDQPTNNIYTVQFFMLKASLSSFLSAQGSK